MKSKTTWAFASRHVNQTKHLKDNNQTTHKIRNDVCTVLNEGRQRPSLSNRIAFHQKHGHSSKDDNHMNHNIITRR